MCCYPVKISACENKGLKRPFAEKQVYASETVLPSGAQVLVSFSTDSAGKAALERMSRLNYEIAVRIKKAAGSQSRTDTASF